MFEAVIGNRFYMFYYNHENISQNTFNKLFVVSKDDLITDAEMV